MIVGTGDMDKPAVGISVGRNSAGVYFLSGYRDGSNKGEGIAIGMHEDQALCDLTGNFVLSMPKFDGAIVRIGDR